MSTALEAASLVMVPSGYEDGTLASVKPTDGTGDFTFSRGSDISATRVNADGYIEKGYENLLLQSNSFDTSPWVSSNLNLSWDILPNQTGYDGSNNAWSIGKSVSTNGYWRQVINPTGLATHSLYAKSGSLNGLLIFGGAPVFRANLDTGASYGFARNIIYFNITSLDNGWKKIVFTCIDGDVNIQPQDADNNVSAAGNILIQNYQINQGLVAYPYIETTTAPVAGGILEDMPRLDYSNGSCPALLLEPQRTNVLPYSEYLFSSTYSFNRILVSSNSIVSPENKLNASKLIVSSGAGITRMFRQTGGSGSQVVSIFAKAGEMNAISVSSYTGSAYLYAMYNLTNGTLINSNADDTGIEDMGDGWYRIWVYVATSSGRYAHISVGQSTDSPSPFINTIGNNVDGIYAYGFQAEQDATYPTSYIPTYGVSQTRLRDDCVNAGDSSLFNSTGGVLFFEASALFDDTTRRHISVSDGSTTNRLVLRYDTSSNSIQTFVQVGGLIYANLRTSNYTITDNLKMAFKWESGNQKLYVNGQIVDSSTDVFAFSQNILNNLSFTRGGTSQPFYGNTKQLVYFPTALTDSECIELTTI